MIKDGKGKAMIKTVSSAFPHSQVYCENHADG